jgi:ornithine cyclodeaminase
LQLKYLKDIFECRDVSVWGRSAKELDAYYSDMKKEGFNILTTNRVSELAKSCNLIVCTTPSMSPLLFLKDLRPGTHITAIGSDTPHKQELDPMILKHADLVVGDSLEQCKFRGEIYQAVQTGSINMDKAVELGHVIAGSVPGRDSDGELTVADLTGVAVQDIRIAGEVYRSFLKN